MTSHHAARAWHVVTALGVAGVLVLQTSLTVTAEGAPLATRLVRLFSYFTIDSNVVVGVSAVLLAQHPARRDGIGATLRLASLVMITITGVVYTAVLRPLAAFTGAWKVADVLLHYVVPLLAVVGWLLFGPRPRQSWSTLRVAIVLPLAWVCYTLLHGGVTGWYPYHFIDVREIGYPRALLNGVGVLLLLLAVGAAYVVGDRSLRAAPAAPADGALHP